MATRTILFEVNVGGNAGQSLDKLKADLKQLLALQGKLPEGGARFRAVSEQAAKLQAQIRGTTQRQRELTRSFAEQEFVPGSYNAIKAEVARLDDVLRNSAVGVNITQERYNQLTTRVTEARNQMRQFGEATGRSGAIGRRISEGLISGFKSVATTVAASYGAITAFNKVKDLASLGFDLERGFAKVNTVAQLSREELKKMQDDITEVASTSAADLAAVPDALFDLISATGDVTFSQEAMKVSLRASKAGFSELGETANAGIGIYNAFKGEFEDLDGVMDLLFRTQKEGVLSFGDLARVFPKLGPGLKAVGLGADEGAAALATLTKNGIGADKAATFLDNALKSLADPVKVAKIEKYTTVFDEQTGAIKPFTEIIGGISVALDELGDDSRARGELLSGLGLDAEAAKGVSILANDLDTFKEVSESIIEGSAGELDRQFAASANTSDDMTIAVNQLKIQLINGLQPAFTLMAKGLIGFVKGVVSAIGWVAKHKELLILLVGTIVWLNRERLKQTAITAANTVVTIANNVATKAAAIGTAIWTGATKAASIATAVLTGRIGLATAAQLAWNAAKAALGGPLGVAIAGVTALGFAIFTLFKNTEDLTREQQLLKDINEELAETYAEQAAAAENSFRVLAEGTAGTKEYSEAIVNINKNYARFLPNLLTEESSLEDIKNARELVLAGLREEIKLKIIKEKRDKIQRDAIQLEFGLTNKLIEETGKSVSELERLAREGAANITEGIGVEKSTKEFADFFKSLSDDGRRAFFDLSTSIKGVDEDLAILDKFLEKDRTAPVGPQGTGGFEVVLKEAESVAFLEKELSKLKETQKATVDPEGWKAVQVEIDAVQKRIEAIMGVSKESGAGQSELRKKIVDNTQKNLDALRKLRDEETKLRLDNIEDFTVQQIQKENEEFKKRLANIKAIADQVINSEQATGDQVAQAIAGQNAIVEQLEIDHAARVAAIKDKAAEKEKKRLEGEHEEEQKTAADILDLKIDSLEIELEIREQSLDDFTDIMKKRSEFLIRQLEIETTIALASAKTDEERNAIMANHYLQKEKIVKDLGDAVGEEAREGEKLILSQLLGVEDKDLEAWKKIVGQAVSIGKELLSEFFSIRMDLINEAIEETDSRLDDLNSRFDASQERMMSLEEQLGMARGARREALIQGIEQERQKQAQLAAEQEAAEKKKQVLQEQAIEIQIRQEKMSRLQAQADRIATAAKLGSAIAIQAGIPFPLNIAAILGTVALVEGVFALMKSQAANLEKGGKVPLFARGGSLANGGKAKGPSHTNGGIPLLVNGKHAAEMQGEEYVVNTQSTARNESVLERINREGRHKTFAISEVQSFEQGGRLPGAADVAAGNANANNAKMISLMEEIAVYTRATAVKPNVIDIAPIGQAFAEKARYEDEAKIT